VDNLPGPVQEAVDAANRGDVEAFLGVFDDAGVVDNWGPASSPAGTPSAGGVTPSFDLDGPTITRMTIRA
jgi:hypothetical protein